jgi:transcriptional regulator with XRE-family HTH domain
MSDKNLEKLVAKFKKAREAKGLTQEQLAMKAGTERNYYAQIERGTITPSFTMLSKIAKALDIELF